MAAHNHSSSRDAWIIAWALAFLLHALAIVGIRHFPPIGGASATRPALPEPVQLVFSPQAPTPAREEKPRFFSELPPDRKDVAPAKADFLSNVTSRARDMVPGGDATLPRMRGEGDAPMVGLEPSGGSSHPPASSPPAPPSPPLTTPRPSPPSTGTSAAPLVALPPETRGVGGPAATAPRQNAGPTAQAHEDQGALFGYGRSDMHQAQMDNPEGNASLTGDVSLNTTQWDYAPWMQRFGRRLMQTWYAPEAYYLGVLKDGGWAVIEVEIAPSGQLLRLDLLEEHGHPSLIRAATSAVRGMDPMERLPAGFPEKTLILRIRMIYPKIRRL